MPSTRSSPSTPCSRRTPKAGHRADRGHDRPRQRLEGAEAGHGPERRSAQPFESAQSTLQGAGFAVAREDVEDRTQPPEPWSARTRPPARSRARAPRSRCRSPRARQTSQVPDVTGQTEATRRAQLQQSGFQVQVVEEIVDDQSLDGRVLSQDPAGGSDAEQGTTVVIVVGRFEQPHAPPADDARPRRRRSREQAHPGRRRRRRALQRARDLARLGPLGARGARSGTLRDDARSRSAATAAGRSAVRATESVLEGECRRDAAGARRLEAGGGDRRRRRRAARPARAVRRGRHRSGPARAGGRPVRRRGVAASALCMDKDLFKAVLRDRGIPVARNATLRARRRDREPVRLSRSSSSRRGSAPRSGSRRPTTRRSWAAVALARRHDEKVLVEEFVAGTEVECGVLGNRGARSRRVAGEIVPHGRVVRLRGQVRRGRHGDHRARPDLPTRSRRAFRSSPSTRSSRPTARAWRASTSSCARTARSSSTS